MKVKFRIVVKTGDQEGAGTDANVYVFLEDEGERVTEQIKLDRRFHDDLERGKIDIYSLDIPDCFGRITTLHIHRDDYGRGDDWFCDYIIVQDERQSKPPRKISNANARSPGVMPHCGTDKHKQEYYFPIHRWVDAGRSYLFHEYASYLPQQDPCKDPRRTDLEAKRQKYKFGVKVEGGPAQVESLPSDEKFSGTYLISFVTEKAKLLVEKKVMEWSTAKLTSIADLRNGYWKDLEEPKNVEHWDCDWWFGIQRLQGVNPVIIELCKCIPEKLGVTEETVSGLLDGLTLRQALEASRMFICDLQMMQDLNCKDNRVVAAPIALFFLKEVEKNGLKFKIPFPVAIQLMQNKGLDNPVFTPRDHKSTWTVAKMFYNNAEAQHHQSLTHLGFTHLLMEGVCVCTHRNLSPSHPLFKLMAPHFLFLLAINSRGLEYLLSPGGWVDKCMTQGIDGMFQFMIRGFDAWTYQRYGAPEFDLKHRGVFDHDILPYYPYRDDAVELFDVIKSYVTEVVTHHYDTPNKICEDWELQAWRQELVNPRGLSGVGLKGLPGNDKCGFATAQEVIDTVTTIISTCSLGHAAANFQQYEQYAFVPNYPGILKSVPPTKKVEYSEKDLIALLPDKQTTLDIMVITKLLSNRGTKSLGDFEMQYLYDPVGVKAADAFRRELKKLSYKVLARNVDRYYDFSWLDPAIIPNSISI